MSEYVIETKGLTKEYNGKYYNLINEREAIIYEWICNRNKRVN